MRRRINNGARPGAKDLNPGGDVAAYLVERAVRISWQLDRADFHERARLAKRILKAPGNRKGARECAVEELIRRLLDPDNLGQADTASSARKRSSSRRKQEREISDDPQELIREAGILGRGVPQAPGRVGQAPGERGRLDRLRRRDLRRDGPSQAPAATPRLSRRRDGRPGRARPLPAPDPPGPGARRGRGSQENSSARAGKSRSRRISRTIREEPLAHETGPPEPESESLWPPDPVDDPATPPSPELLRLRAEFRTMVAEEYDRLTCRLKELEGGKADDEGHDADRADRVAFDDSPEGDRLHRYQAHWSRSLLRTLDAIHREGKQDEHDDRADGDEDVPSPGSSTADEPEVGRRRVPDAVLEVDPAVNAASESAPQGGEVNSAKQTHGEVPRPLKAEPCGERSKRGKSGETPREGLQTHEPHQCRALAGRRNTWKWRRSRHCSSALP